VAWDQFEMPSKPVPPTAASDTAEAPACQTTEDRFAITGDGFSAAVARANGALISYQVDGVELLTGPLLPSFWKAPNDNQMRSRYVQQVRPWRDAVAGAKLVEIKASEAAGAVQVVAAFKLPVGGSDYRLTYRVGHAGQIGVEASYTPGQGSLPLLPRFGVTWAMPQQYSEVAWYGRGPQETYWDRQTGGEISIYKNTVDEWVFPYVRPQDTGNRTDVRWMTLTNKEGLGVKVTGAVPLSVSAWPFTIADVEAAMHPYELPRREFNTVFVDYRLHGVGGDNSWGALTHPEYTLPGDKPYGFSFTISPVRAK
jgi:beta-galactosidase